MRRSLFILFVVGTLALGLASCSHEVARQQLADDWSIDDFGYDYGGEIPPGTSQPECATDADCAAQEACGPDGLCHAIAPPADDTDGDGVPDDTDAFPDDASESKDTDGDGIGDNTDRWPDQASIFVVQSMGNKIFDGTICDEDNYWDGTQCKPGSCQNDSQCQQGNACLKGECAFLLADLGLSLDYAENGAIQNAAWGVDTPFGTSTTYEIQDPRFEPTVPDTLSLKGRSFTCNKDGDDYTPTAVWKLVNNQLGPIQVARYQGATLKYSAAARKDVVGGDVVSRRFNYSIPSGDAFYRAILYDHEDGRLKGWTMRRYRNEIEHNKDVATLATTGELEEQRDLTWEGGALKGEEIVEKHISLLTDCCSDVALALDVSVEGAPKDIVTRTIASLKSPALQGVITIAEETTFRQILPAPEDIAEVRDLNEFFVDMARAFLLKETEVSHFEPVFPR